MKWLLIAVALVLGGCQTCPPQKQQLELKVPPQLLVKPEPLQQL